MLQKHSVVRLAGNPGEGRSTVLQQYHEQIDGPSVLLHFDSSDRSSYLPSSISTQLFRDLGPLFATNIRADQTLERLPVFLANVARRASKAGTPVTVVVDGFDEIPEADAPLQSAILSILPLRQSGYRILISSSTASERLEGTYEHRISPFTRIETRMYLEAVGIPQTIADTVHDASKGWPGELASAARIWNSTGGAERIRQGLKAGLQPTAIEWGSLSLEAEITRRVVGLVAFASTPYTVSEISSLASIPGGECAMLIEDLPCLSIARDSGRIAFISNDLRRVARERLKGVKRDVFERIAGTDSLGYREATYPEDAKDLRAIVQYSDASSLEAILRKEGSLASVYRRLRSAAESAVQLNHHEALIRCRLSSMLLAEAESRRHEAERIRSLFWIGKVEEARERALSVTSDEGRLCALAALSGCFAGAGMSIYPEVADEIPRLVENVDARFLRSMVMDQAQDLLAAYPGTFFRAVDRVKSSGSNVDGFDSEIAIQGIRAAVDRRNQDVDSREIVQLLRTAVGSSPIADIAEQTAVLVSSRSGPDVCRAAKEIASDSARLELKRLWCAGNARRADALEVAIETLEELVATPKITISAGWLRELARVARFATKSEDRERFVRLIEAQLPRAREIGPSEAYIAARVSLALRSDNQHAVEALEEIHLELTIEPTPEADVLAVGLAQVCAACIRLGSDYSGPSRGALDDLYEWVRSSLSSALQRLIANTAAHESALDGIVREIALVDPAWARDIASLANSSDRRDQLRAKLCLAIAGSRSGKWSGSLAKAVDSIEGQTIRESTITRSLDRIGTLTHNVAGYVPPDKEVVHRLVEGTCTNEGWCLNAARALEIFGSDATKEEPFATYLAQLPSRLNEIVSPVRRRSVMLEVVASLSSVDNVLAIQLQETASTLSAGEPGQDARTWGLRLIAPIFRSLRKKGALVASDFDRVERIIELIPCPVQRLVVWSSISLACYFEDGHTEAKDVLGRFVSPTWAEILTEDCGAAIAVAPDVVPALLLVDHQTPGRAMRLLPQEVKDDSLLETMRILLHRVLPCQSSDEGVWGESGQTLYDACKFGLLLAHNLSEDAAKYQAVRLVYEVLGKPERWTRTLTHNQRAEIAREMEDLVGTFTVGSSVPHNGYELVVRGRILALRQTKKNDILWSSLFSEVLLIDNRADRAFVLGDVASVLPQNMRARSRDLLKQAADLIPEMPLWVDRMSRYRMLVETANEVDKAMRVSLLRCALAEATADSTVGEQRSFEERRRTVDLAYRLDEQMAEELVSKLDDDIRRREVRLELKDCARINKVRSALTSNVREIELGHLDELMAACAKLLRSVNTGLSTGPDFAHFAPVLKYCGDEPISRVFPAVALATESSRRLFEKRQNGRLNLRQLFDDCCSALDCVALIQRPDSSCNGSTWARSAPAAGADALIVTQGQLRQAESFIEDWVRRTEPTSLVLIDPFFRASDVGIIRIFALAGFSGTIKVLTGPVRKDDARLDAPAIRDGWASISHDPMPQVEITTVSNKKGTQCPIHDRWLLGNKQALGLGTSYSGLGRKLSEIRCIEEPRTSEIYRAISPFLRRDEFVNNERLVYSLFTT